LEVVMSAMRAEELPDVPAASPQDSARNRAASRWTAATPATAAEPPTATVTEPPTATAPGLVAPPEPALDRPARPQPARPRPPLDRPARTQQASVPLRLTRRGRVVVGIAAALLLAVLSLVIAGSAQATNHLVPSRAAQQNLTQVTVRPGQSLWSVAENADPDADTRIVIQQIVQLNGLTGDTIFAGQLLWVPRG
jgi:LysM domain